jgi:hypothetical protein
MFRNLVESNPDCDFDLFIYTTDIVQDGAFRFPSQDAVQQRLKELYGNFVRYADRPLDLGDIESVYGSILRYIRVETPQAYGYSQIVSMFWKVRQCDHMRRRHEQETGVDYDLVIRTRSDAMIASPLVLTPYFGRGPAMFQSWLLISPAFDDFGLFMRLMRSNTIATREIVSDFTMGGKFSDILFWSAPDTMRVVDDIFETFLLVANKMQKETGAKPFLPHDEPNALTAWPISLDGLTNIVLHAHGVRPVLAKTFRMFLVMHLILQKDDGTIRFEEAPEKYRKQLLRAYFKNELFEPPCVF